MSSWNYRVFRKKYKDDTYYEIHSVYYDAKGKVKSVSVKPRIPFGETEDEISDDLAKMKAALLKPVLDWEDR